MTSKDKYHDVDELLSLGEDKDDDATKGRIKRPSPAVSVMSGQRRPTLMVDGLKADKQAAEEELIRAKNDFSEEKANLLEELDKYRLEAKPIVLNMPVTKQDVEFQVMRIPPDLIDVSIENERIQDFLDEISLQDILPSLIKHGQQKPGTLRPKDNGRFELIEGSRRLAAVKVKNAIASQKPEDYLALVGNVPDADVSELSAIENKHKDVSAYEKALSFKRKIEVGEFSNWKQVGIAKKISSTHILRYKSCAVLDQIFVRILPSPSDMPLSYGETIESLSKKGKKELYEKANELLVHRSSLTSDVDADGDSIIDVEEIIKQLKSAVRTKIEKPTRKAPITYPSSDGKVAVKHSVTNSGNAKLELVGVSDENIGKIISFLKATLKLKV